MESEISLREMVAAGGRGGFAQKLLAFYDDLTLYTLVEAYSVADSENREALEEVFPEVEYCHGQWYNCTLPQQKTYSMLFDISDYKPNKAKIRQHFPGLKELGRMDYPENLHKIKLRRE